MLIEFSFLLILSFTTDLGNKEEYVIDHSLTKQDCYERMNEEYNDRKNETVEQMYKDAVERYKAVEMEGKVVKVELSCVKGQ